MIITSIKVQIVPSFTRCLNLSLLLVITTELVLGTLGRNTRMNTEAKHCIVHTLHII